MAMVHLYGGKLEDGQTVTVDHTVTSFTVTIRTMGSISAQDVKDQLQKKWEVTHIEEGDSTMYVL